MIFISYVQLATTMKAKELKYILNSEAYFPILLKKWLRHDVSGFYEIPGTKHWKITRLGDYIIPKLKEQGITNEQLEQMLTVNISNLWKV